MWWVPADARQASNRIRTASCVPTLPPRSEPHVKPSPGPTPEMNDHHQHSHVLNPSVDSHSPRCSIKKTQVLKKMHLSPGGSGSGQQGDQSLIKS
ncbi:unnamed protein product [Arctogadus glacialis]